MNSKEKDIEIAEKALENSEFESADEFFKRANEEYKDMKENRPEEWKELQSEYELWGNCSFDGLEDLDDEYE